MERRAAIDTGDVVISEETGAMSVVADGQIERGLSADALRSRLRSLVLKPVLRTRQVQTT